MREIGMFVEIVLISVVGLLVVSVTGFATLRQPAARRLCAST
jgi:hypothetical protein